MLRQRDSAGVGGEDGAGLAQSGDALPEGAFDLEVFGHRLDDPLALCDPVEVVLEVAGSDQGLRGFAHEADRLHPRGALDSSQGGLVALRLAGNHDIEQVHRKSGVGQVGGDARAHRPGAQDRNTA